VSRAWALERNLVNITERGTVDWTPEQIKELKDSDRVRGYEGHHINNFNARPDLTGDPKNIKFLPRDKRLRGSRGHRGGYRNDTKGRLIDRQAMIDQHNRINAIKSKSGS